jgi:hypothetical protein
MSGNTPTVYTLNGLLAASKHIDNHHPIDPIHAITDATLSSPLNLPKIFLYD